MLFVSSARTSAHGRAASASDEGQPQTEAGGAPLRPLDWVCSRGRGGPLPAADCWAIAAADTVAAHHHVGSECWRVPRSPLGAAAAAVVPPGADCSVSNQHQEQAASAAAAAACLSLTLLRLSSLGGRLLSARLRRRCCPSTLFPSRCRSRRAAGSGSGSRREPLMRPALLPRPHRRLLLSPSASGPCRVRRHTRCARGGGSGRRRPRERRRDVIGAVCGCELENHTCKADEAKKSGDERGAGLVSESTPV